jgi:hypothetical protein
MLPETLVLSITVHGSVNIEDWGVSQFNIPADMEIVKVSAVAPGVCNIMTEEDSVEINTTLREFYSDSDITLARAGQTLPKVIGLLRDIESRGIPIISKQNNPMSQHYIRHTDTGFSVVKYDGNTPMIDKVFSRSIGEGDENIHDFKINMLNVPGMPDLFKLFTTGKTTATTRASKSKEYTAIPLSEIVYYLRKNGVKNIVMFDFSCAEMDTDPRTERSFRRSAITRGMNGGKRKTRRRKNKTKTPSTRRRTVWILSSRLSRVTLKSVRSLTR